MTENTSSRPASVRLVGGGRDADRLAPFFADFVTEATARHALAAPPRVHALLVLEPDDDESIGRFRDLLEAAGGTVVVTAINEGEHFEAAAIEGAAGIFVGGGLTPAYRDAFEPIAGAVREAVAAGTPYLGFSAGAAIAAERALVGGYLLNGVPIGDEDAGEELDELTIAPGLGIVPFAVDVHAAQWGTVSRLIAAVDSGMTAKGFAIDEDTCLLWRSEATEHEPTVSGQGAAWRVERTADNAAVTITRLTAH